MLNMFIKYQEKLLKTIKHSSDSKLQKEFLDKLLKSLEDKPVEAPAFSILPSTSKNCYNLITILEKGKKTKTLVKTLQDLILDIT